MLKSHQDTEVVTWSFVVVFYSMKKCDFVAQDKLSHSQDYTALSGKGPGFAGLILLITWPEGTFVTLEE